jgi:regulator of sirC expression with transglutaminase-like and TPR domain
MGMKTAKMYMLRGMAYAKLNLFEWAATDITAAVELDPRNPNYLQNRIVLWTKLGQWKNVTADCTRILELCPNHLLAYTDRGIAYSKLGDFEQAIADLSFAVEHCKGSAKGQALGARATIYGASRKWSLAVDDCTSAKEFDTEVGGGY